jgi:3-deoxy-7-phosphoheptulonate synthase
VLRGGRNRTNYDQASLSEAGAKLAAAGLPLAVMVDCSHANSGKQFARQEEVWQSVIAQRSSGNRSLAGAMVESYLSEGSQPFPQPVEQLRYGLSITDACVSWETTERMLRTGAQALEQASVQR